jgi:LCP family protein required for cell wall assembly
VLLAVSLGLVIAYKALFVRPELPASDAPDGDPIIVSGSGMAPKVSGERKSDDDYTILVLGRDTGGGGNCDTMMLVSYDVTNQKLTVMSIPRDTMVNVPWDVKKINSVYNFYGGGDRGIEKLDKEIADLIGFVPDYSVILEWEAIGKLVDAIGGVYFDVPRNMDYNDPYQNLSIHIAKGYQHLDGEKAMGVVRFRDGKNGYKNGDLGRIETQQAFLKAVMKQLLQVKNVTKIQKFAQIFEQNVTTDLTVQNLFWFGKSAILGGLSMDNVSFVTMPNKTTSCWSRTYKNYQSYVVPDADKLLDMVNTSLSPFVQEVTLGELDIMSVNANGSVSSTTGHVEDSKAAQAPRIPSKTDKTPVDNTGTGESETNPAGETGGQTDQPTGTDGDVDNTGGNTGAQTGETTGENPGGEENTDGDAGAQTGETTGGDTAGETDGNPSGTADGTDGTGDSEDGYGAPAEPAVPAEPDGTVA